MWQRVLRRSRRVARWFTRPADDATDSVLNVSRRTREISGAVVAVTAAIAVVWGVATGFWGLLGGRDAATEAIAVESSMTTQEVPKVTTTTPTPTTTTTTAPVTTTTVADTTTTVPATTTTVPPIPLFDGWLGHFENAELTRALIKEATEGRVVELRLFLSDSVDPRPIAHCDGGRCRSVAWVSSCNTTVTAADLETSQGAILSCPEGLLTVSVDGGDDLSDEWYYARGVWQLEGYFAVDQSRCERAEGGGPCSILVRRLPPEVVQQILN